MPLDAHDAAQLVGADTYEQLRDLSLRIYALGAARAQERGLVLADTKFEFGELDGEILVIDEMMTPDSSRYWSMESYKVGTSPPSFDKQFVRDFMEGTGWNKEAPAPRVLIHSLWAVLTEEIRFETMLTRSETHRRATSRRRSAHRAHRQARRGCVRRRGRSGWRARVHRRR